MRDKRPLQLTGRSSSHFTRVVRMLAHELAVPIELDVVADLCGLDAANYGGHPGLKIPTLHVGDAMLFGTEHICRKLAEIAGRSDDSRVVLAHHVASEQLRNAQELVWHAMAAQVQLVVGTQLANLPLDNVMMAKAHAGLAGTLSWLEDHVEPSLAELPAPRHISVLEVALFCLLQHIVFRPTVSLAGTPKLRRFASSYAFRESARCTVFRFDSR